MCWTSPGAPCCAVMMLIMLHRNDAERPELHAAGSCPMHMQFLEHRAKKYLDNTEWMNMLLNKCQHNSIPGSGIGTNVQKLKHAQNSLCQIIPINAPAEICHGTDVISDKACNMLPTHKCLVSCTPPADIAIARRRCPLSHEVSCT